MRVPRFLRPRDIPEGGLLLPAMGMVLAGGFLGLAPPLARFGTSALAPVYMLLTPEQRSSVARSIPGFDGLWQRLQVGTEYAPAVLHTGGNSQPRWENAENLWVAAAWLVEIQRAQTQGQEWRGDHTARMVLEVAAKVVG